MTPVQKLRFKRFIKMLENLPAELKKTRIPGDGPLKKWNMGVWGCGTAACALGTAALHPYFQKHGLTTQSEQFRDGWRRVVFDGREGYYAGAAFFGLRADDAYKIFYADESCTPKRVAKIAREVLSHYA